MVGMTLALLLAKARPDWHVAIVDEKPIQSPASTNKDFDARSTALAAGSRQILQACGVWSHLVQSLTPISQVHVSDRGHLAGTLLSADDYRCSALGYVVENPDFGSALLTSLADTSNISLMAPVAITQLCRHQLGWKVALEGRVLNCKLLVLADGSKSLLARSLGIEHITEDYGQSAIIANLELDGCHQGIAYERFTHRGPIALLPLAGARGRKCALIWTRPPDITESLMALDDEVFCRRLQSEFGYRPGLIRKVGTRQTFPLQLSVAREQIRTGLVLMGNAAHALHPVAGQGFNLALRDCQSLVEQITPADDPGSLTCLHKYHTARATDQTATLALSHTLVKLFSTAAAPYALVRALGLIGLDAINPAKRAFARQAMGYPLAGNIG